MTASSVSRARGALVGGLLLLAPVVFAADIAAADLRIGLIGLDTSHTVSFAKILNDPKNPEHVPGATIVAAFKGGSPDVEDSARRIDGFTNTMVKTYGVRLYDTIEGLAQNVDALMILSVDGRTHLEQARRAFPFHKPVFIDKPIAASLRDAIEILRLARAAGTPCFSSSSRRFDPGVVAVKTADIGELHGVFSYGPATLEAHHPDLFWYGVHATEALYAVMGRGCQNVVRTQAPNAEIVTGVWADGRVGTVRGTRNEQHVYGLIAFGSKANAENNREGGYAPLIAEVVKFFRTGIAPVPSEETIEIFTFMEAADESKRRGGAPVALADVLKSNGDFPASAPPETLR